MELKCKDESCKSDQIRGPDKNRFVCLQCGRIFVTDDLDVKPLPLPSSAIERERLEIERRPECFGNYDSDCPICTKDCPVEKKCSRSSPPIDSDFFVAPDDDTSILKCPACGTLQQGVFCSKCGAALQDESAPSLFKKVIQEHLITGWPEYFRTLINVAFSPNEFFSGAFSKQSRRFHYDSRTLEPAKFLSSHITFIGVATLILNWLLLTSVLKTSGLAWISQNVIDFLLLFAWMYVPAGLLLLALKHEDSFPELARRVNIAGGDSQISLHNVLKAIIYVAGIDVLSLPFFVLLGSMLMNSSVRDYADPEIGLFFYIFSLALASIPKMISLKIHLPKALTYACRVPKAMAEKAVIGFVIFCVALYFALKYALKWVLMG